MQHLLVLVGLPGSGKGLVADQLQEAGWRVVSQDQRKKSRKRCESAVRYLLKEGHDVVVDRCNGLKYFLRHRFDMHVEKNASVRFTCLVCFAGLCTRVDTT